MPPCPRNTCCESAECLAQCFCAIRIDMPLPDLVDEATGPSCPPADCNISAQCWSCYLLLDGIFKKASATRYYVDDCGNLSYTSTNTPIGDCDSFSLGWGNLDTAANEEALACWNPANYTCPDCSTESFLQCGSQYGVAGPVLLLSIICEDGCCTLELTITYTVHQYCDELVVLPDPDPVSPRTTYTHTFSVSDICSCEDLAGAVLTYSGTTSSNNGRGITVPDVCNVASATVSLVNDDNCGCICFDCLDFSNDINVALTGGEFTGTVVATYEPYSTGPLEDRNTCTYRGGVTGATCGFTVEVEIECLPCEKYNITVRLRTGDGVDECIATYELLATDCATLSGFTFVSQTGTCPCDLDDFTISLS
jgi:hypothetical protein